MNPVRRSFSLGVVSALIVAGLSSHVPATASGPAEGALVTGPGGVLTYATYFGAEGLSESVNAVTTDADGNVFITGVLDGAIATTPGAFRSAPAGLTDAFVAKLDDAGQLRWLTYFGGSHADSGSDIALGPNGSVIVAGTTLSDDLPTTSGAFQRSFKGQNTGCEFVCAGDAFVASFAPDGSSLTYSTYLGGGLNETASALAVSPSGEAIVAGWTTSSDFPATQGAYDSSYNQPSCGDMCDADVFVARLNPAGTQLRDATYLGGSSWDSAADVALGGNGKVYVGGGTRSTDLPTTPGSFQPEKQGNGDFDFNGFVAAFEGDLSAVTYSTYFGGREEDHVIAIAVDADGRAWITGFAGSALKTTEDALQRKRRGPSDAFVAGFKADGSGLAYATRFGGSNEDYGRAIAIDDKGRIVMSGSTASKDLRTRHALQSGNAGLDDLFFVRFTPGAERPKLSTYIGGENFEAATGVALSPEGSAYVSGSSESRSMPLAGRFVQADQGRNDGVLLRIDTGRLTHLKVDDEGFWQRRVRANLGATLKWHFANTAEGSMRLRETGANLLDTKARRPGSEYYFTFPAGRFTVAHIGGNVAQRIAVSPAATYGETPGTVEVRWARFPLGQDILFDVQVKVGETPWQDWLTQTREIGGTYAGGPADYRFRVRVHNRTAGTTTPWSPAGLLSSPS